MMNGHFHLILTPSVARPIVTSVTKGASGWRDVVGACLATSATPSLGKAASAL